MLLMINIILGNHEICSVKNIFLGRGKTIYQGFFARFGCLGVIFGLLNQSRSCFRIFGDYKLNIEYWKLAVFNIFFSITESEKWEQYDSIFPDRHYIYPIEKRSLDFTIYLVITTIIQIILKTLKTMKTLSKFNITKRIVDIDRCSY